MEGVCIKKILEKTCAAACSSIIQVVQFHIESVKLLGIKHGQIFFLSIRISPVRR